jgi:hypothetical protein
MGMVDKMRFVEWQLLVALGKVLWQIKCVRIRYYRYLDQAYADDPYNCMDFPHWLYWKMFRKRFW